MLLAGTSVGLASKKNNDFESLDSLVELEFYVNGSISLYIWQLNLARNKFLDVLDFLSCAFGIMTWFPYLYDHSLL